MTKTLTKNSATLFLNIQASDLEEIEDLNDSELIKATKQARRNYKLGKAKRFLE